MIFTCMFVNIHIYYVTTLLIKIQHNGYYLWSEHSEFIFVTIPQTLEIKINELIYFLPLCSLFAFSYFSFHSARHTDFEICTRTAKIKAQEAISILSQSRTNFVSKGNVLSAYGFVIFLNMADLIAKISYFSDQCFVL